MITENTTASPMISLIQGDCLAIMKEIADASIDLTVTSPPYDSLRSYNGNNETWCQDKWQSIIKDLYRVTCDGGVVVWIVGDATLKGSETGTSFRQALYAIDCGFRLHDTMIYQKNSYPFPPSNRYYQQFEYMFVLSKNSPKTFNGIRQATKWQKSTKEISTTRNPDGSTSTMKYGKGKKDRLMDNVWVLNTGYMRSSKDKESFKHPATFPEKLAKDHIISWSNEGDTVLDPFMGSGTTGKMAKQLKRNFIGIEIDVGYLKIAHQRINQQETLF